MVIINTENMYEQEKKKEKERASERDEVQWSEVDK